MDGRSLAAWTAPWLAAYALLLQIGMPSLAGAAAQLNGFAVGEVREVCGVLLASRPARHHGVESHVHHQPRHQVSANDEHDCDHCALAALRVMGTPYGRLLPRKVEPAAGSTARETMTAGPMPDARAKWAARIVHGPPIRA